MYGAPDGLPSSSQAPAQLTTCPACLALAKKSVKSACWKLRGDRLTPFIVFAGTSGAGVELEAAGAAVGDGTPDAGLGPPQDTIKKARVKNKRGSRIAMMIPDGQCGVTPASIAS